MRHNHVCKLKWFGGAFILTGETVEIGVSRRAISLILALFSRENFSHIDWMAYTANPNTENAFFLFVLLLAPFPFALVSFSFGVLFFLGRGWGCAHDCSQFHGMLIVWVFCSTSKEGLLLDLFIGPRSISSWCSSID